MAKKKIEDDIGDANIQAAINKKYGNVCRPASEILESKLEVFSTGSPNIDLALSGGLQEGSLVEIVGLPKVGKTSLACQSLTSYMAAGRKCFFFDNENRFDKKNLRMRGMEPEKLNVIRSEDNKIMDANDTFNCIEQIIRAEKGCAIVLDSLSTLISRDRATDEVDAQRRDTRPKLTADFLQGVSPLIRINRATFIVIRHFGTNMDPRGTKYSPDGGMKMSFRMDTSLHCKWSEKWLDANEKIIGKIMHFDILCSSLAGPVDKVDSYLRFDLGIDQEKETLMQAIDYGIVEKSSSWLNLSYLEEPIKLQGEERVVTHLRENPESYKLLRSKIKELLV